MSTQSKAALIQWMRVNHPALYETAMARVSGNLGALSDTISKVFSTITDTVAKLGPAYVQTRASLELLKANVKRAKQGLPPAGSLDEVGYENAGGGGGGFNVGGMNISPMMLAVIGIGAFLILRRK